MTESNASSEFRAAGNALLGLSEDEEALAAVLTAAERGDSAGFRSALKEIMPPLGPTFPYACRVISGAAFIRLPDFTKEVCWWNVGPNAGQIYKPPDTIDVNGQQVQAPDWLKQYLISIGAITCSHPIVRQLIDFWSATCEPDY